MGPASGHQDPPVPLTGHHQLRDSDVLSDAAFTRVRLNDARLRRVDLTGAQVRGSQLHRVRLRGVELLDVEISGELLNVVVNGVDIAPLVEAELDRRTPERAKMRPADADGFREAWAILEGLWEQTVARARTFPEPTLHRGVDDEWSFIQTLRHLSFASAAWVGRMVLGDPSPWHPLDLPWDEAPGWDGIPWDRDARPSLDEALALRRERQAVVRESDMGLDVWVARNDRGREWSGHRFSDLPRMRTELPHQFDEATNRTVELIDVLWLKGNAVVAAFEVESTTSIYSGLLRMADLLAMQPNLNIPLYLVAPDERRQKVFAEVNRPTFSKLPTPLVDVCRYISFSSLREHVARAQPYIRYLKADFLDELSEACVTEDL